MQPPQSTSRLSALLALGLGVCPWYLCHQYGRTPENIMGTEGDAADSDDMDRGLVGTKLDSNPQ